MTLRDWNNMDESTVSADTIVDFKDLSTHYLNSRENRVLVVLYFYLFYYYYFFIIFLKDSINHELFIDRRHSALHVSSTHRLVYDSLVLFLQKCATDDGSRTEEACK